MRPSVDPRWEPGAENPPGLHAPRPGAPQNSHAHGALPPPQSPSFSACPAGRQRASPRMPSDWEEGKLATFESTCSRPPTDHVGRVVVGDSL